MADRRAALRDLGRIGPFLAVAAVAGFLLGACGEGDQGGRTTGTSQTTSTRAALTATRTAERPAPTVPTPTVAPTTEITTTDVTTTAPEPPSRITVTETQTTASVPIAPATTSTTSTATTTLEPGESTSSADGTPWGWIALGVALAAAAVIGILVWRRRRAGAASWSFQMEDLTRRCLIALDDVLADGSVVTGEIQALAAEARSLEARAPDDSSKADGARLRAHLDDLAGVLESDRTLRLSSPPPSAEQITYSTALIHQQVEQLQGVLRPPSVGQAPA